MDKAPKKNREKGMKKYIKKTVKHIVKEGTQKEQETEARIAALRTKKIKGELTDEQFMIALNPLIKERMEKSVSQSGDPETEQVKRKEPTREELKEIYPSMIFTKPGFYQDIIERTKDRNLPPDKYREELETILGNMKRHKELVHKEV
jgi:hypothetical protein